MLRRADGFWRYFTGPRGAENSDISRWVQVSTARVRNAMRQLGNCRCRQDSRELSARVSREKIETTVEGGVMARSRVH